MPHRDDVYGISRNVPLNYVERPDVDQKLISCLTQKKHITIFGSSKQGKTCLRKHALEDQDYIVVQCGNQPDLASLYSLILKQAGFEVTQSQKKTVEGRHKIFATLKAIWADGGVEAERSKTDESTSAPIELDPADVNDVIEALKSIKFEKFVVLEDFHYLPENLQVEFSVGLKAFHELSDLVFIVVGVWLEENRLIVHNGDLAGRLLAVDVDDWTAEQLAQVIDAGEKLLNVRFGEDFKSKLIRLADGSVYIVQECCRRLCEKAKVVETIDGSPKALGRESDVAILVDSVVSEHNARYQSFLTNAAEGFKDNILQINRWLLFAIVTSELESLRTGLMYQDIRKTLQKHHPRGDSLNLGNLTIALQKLSSLQIKKGIKPIVLDYDQTNRRLNVVDRSFLIWLSRQDKDDLLESIHFEKTNSN